MANKIKTKHSINNAKILVIKSLHGLTNQDVANMTGYTKGSVSSWFNKPSSPSYRKAPDDAYRKLNSKYSMEIE